MPYNCGMAMALGPSHALKLWYGYGLGTTTCLIIVVEGRQGHAPCNILFLQEVLFFCQTNFMEIIRLSQSCWKSG